MTVNDRNTPVALPNNEWTQMIEAARARNQRGTSLTPADIAAGVPFTGTPMPAVRSADLGRPVAAPVEDPNRPLNADEIEALNRAALASGLVVGPVNPSIANTLGAAADGDVPYATLEEAIAAGAPVGADAEDVAAGAMRFRAPMPSTPIVHVRAPIGMARAAAGVVMSAPQMPRLPDFKLVQMIDLVNAKVYVDGMEFTLTPGEAKTLRKFCVTKAREQIQTALDAAMKALAEDEDGGAEAV